MKPIKIGIIGLGSIANGRHLPEIANCPDLELLAICDINESKLQVTAEKYGIDARHCFTDYHDLVNCADVEAVDICTPNYLHFDMGMAAVNAGKPYAIEKPITINGAQADILANATKERGLKNMVCFSYRFVPAVRYLRDIIKEGKLGRIYHVNMEYSQGWALPIAHVGLAWRFDKKQAGSGTLGDLGSHGLDLVRFVTGKNYTKICAMANTFVKEREKLDKSGMGTVDVDDYCNCLSEMEDEISVTFHFTRCALGRPNYQRIEVYGGEGSAIYDIEKDSLNVFGKNFEGQKIKQAFTMIPIPDTYRVGQMRSFANIINDCGDGLPATIFDGQTNQHTIDAIIQSYEKGLWVKL